MSKSLAPINDINLKIFDEYIETFHIVDDEFYK